MTRAELIENLSQLDLCQIQSITKSKLDKNQIIDVIKIKPPSNAEIKILDKNKRVSVIQDENPKFCELRQRLLSIGGYAALIPDYEEYLDNILLRGQLWSGKCSKMMKGQPSQCHRNSCDLWYENRDKVLICTGYALSNDGIWRQHSWCIWLRPRVNTIVETTMRREAYYGYVMTYSECKQFDLDNQ